MNNMKKQSISWKKAGEASEKKPLTILADSRVKDVLLVSILAFVLTFAVWKVCNEPSNSSVETIGGMSTSEKRISQILSNIHGVGNAEVIISEDEDGVKGAVVVCEGANNLRVVMDVREAVAIALNIQEANIKIYLKKE